jgi:hypothetical protein
MENMQKHNISPGYTTSLEFKKKIRIFLNLIFVPVEMVENEFKQNLTKLLLINMPI